MEDACSDNIPIRDGLLVRASGARAPTTLRFGRDSRDMAGPNIPLNAPHETLLEPEEESKPAPVIEFDGEFQSGETDAAEHAPALPYLVAGIGASAGGVEAYTQLISALAPETGIAFVLIPHLLPTHKSHMVEICSRHTNMRVVAIEDGASPQPNLISIAPPRFSGESTGRRLSAATAPGGR